MGLSDKMSRAWVSRVARKASGGNKFLRADVVNYARALYEVHRVPTPTPLRVAKAGRYYLNGEIIPPPPHWGRQAIEPNRYRDILYTNILYT
jgi:hypothetical protein